MLKNYFKVAWRNLARNKTYAIINVSGLALGVCACLIIYLVASFELSYDNFHPDKERIYRVVSALSGERGTRHMAMVPDPAPQAMRDEITGLESIVLFRTYKAKVSTHEGVERKFDMLPREEAPDMIIAEPQYFSILHYQWLAGNPATALQEPFKVVLTESRAKKYFGQLPADAVLGKTIMYNDSLPVTVSGVVKDMPANSDFIFKDFISFATTKNSFLGSEFGMDQWGMFSGGTQAFVKLEKGVTPARVEAQFPAFVKKHFFVEEHTTAKVTLQPLADLHFNPDYEDNYTRKAHLPTLYGLMGIAAFILLIAAINFVNLATAQSIERTREVGIRKVLGSTRSTLVLQFLSETFILVLLATGASLLFTPGIIAVFKSFIPDGVAGLLFSRPTAIFILLLIVCTTLLAGVYPALVSSAYLPALSLKGGDGLKGSERGYLRKGLIIFQFAVSLVFIIGTLVISNQMRYMLNKDMGFKKDAIIAVPTARYYPYAQKDVLAERIRGISGVENVSVSESTPAAKGHWGTLLTYKGKEKVEIESALEWGDEKFVPLYNLKLVAGRNVMPADSMREFLVNESCAKALGFRNPADAVGKMVESGISDGSPTTCPIVGVLKDFHVQSLHEPIKPMFFTTNKKISRTINIRLATNGKRSQDLKRTLAQIEQLWTAVYPNEKFDYTFFDASIARFYEKEQKTAALMNTAMAIAIFISCMGLFGLAAFTARQRTREIGIRKVLGASVANITTMLSKDFVMLVLIALVIAAPIAWYFMHRWLEGFAYQVSISWWIYVIAGLTAMIIALITVSFQAIKAAVADPVKSLRME
ncbi:FtsX-like permease family protein [Chitinophaga agrisoli]|uniref:FtsX-like permease family protein n=1 Tax=Chitinophaga agrisoli TaxID=2607653 RepID=A0A5B2VM63_9BACT|nr:ABC transporter permease [Chitinophaga agrisoli]KAA2240025.1 FtsX-like permease family protein [Chitinophaga agrisoli]